MTLTEFFKARIEEDEEEGFDHYSGHEDGPITPGAPCVECGDAWPCAFRRRWLAECEAKRRIVAEHYVETVIEEGVDVSPDCPDCWQPWPCTTLRILATVYNDHPDYRAEWAV